MKLRTDRDKTEEIKKELAELTQSLKMTVHKAIYVGQLLTEQRKYLGHGNFVPWIEANFQMGQASAYRFIKLFDHSDKITNLGNLQDAYKQIETLEKQEKMTTDERNRSLIAEYRKTGVKPEGWDRSLDYVIQRDKEAGVKQKERIEKTFQDREDRAKDYQTEYKLNDTTYSDALRSASDSLIKKLDQQAEWKEKIRLSDGGKDDAFMDAIIEYFETLPDDNRRIEACNNIIKICRNISVELQRNVA